MTDLTLTVERRINAPAARVYDAWLNPETLVRFMSNWKWVHALGST